MSGNRLDSIPNLNKKLLFEVQGDDSFNERKDLDFTELLWTFFLGLELAELPALFSELFENLDTGKLKPAVCIPPCFRDSDE